jgi:Transposase DDE domain group 1
MARSALAPEVLQVTPQLRRRLHECQRRIKARLDPKLQRNRSQPMFLDQNIHYDLADKTHGLHSAGLGICQQLIQRLGLAQALDSQLHLFKRHFPYFESDHILNLTYNFLVGGKNLQDLERLRNQEHYLDVLGAQRIPDPTTAGDFLRRFSAADLDTLMNVINAKRLRVWQQQPAAFFAQAIVEGDGTLVATSGACKQGADMAYDGTWGYHPLLISLANTQEPLFVVNRSGNRPSYEGAAAYFDKAADLCRGAGFRQILFRGDTDFTQAAHLDRWQQAGIGFVFGIDAQPNLVALAQGLPERVWTELERPPSYQVKTKPRQRPANVKDAVVRRRGYRNVQLLSEQVAEFNYQPGPCQETYLIVVLRKQLLWEQGGVEVDRETRYFFYITNRWTWSCAEVVQFANDRGNQENLVEQLKNGVPALRAPVNTLEANGAWMVLGALAWNLKVWLGLLQPATTYGQRLLTLEFKGFLSEVMLLPCQIVRASGRLLYRVLQWNPWVGMLCALSERLRQLRWT